MVDGPRLPGVSGGQSLLLGLFGETFFSRCVAQLKKGFVLDGFIWQPWT
jgi:hypothetical protein